MYKEVVAKVATNRHVEKYVSTSKVLRPMVERFVAGETQEQGLLAVARLNEMGMAASLDFLGEEVHTEEDALRVRDEYLTALANIHTYRLNTNISLKLTQMGLAFNPALCLENVATIAEAAESTNNFVRIDMEGSGYTQATLDVFYELFKNHPNLGVVMQAYLYRTRNDVETLIDHEARIRLCKGAYREPATVAYPNKIDVDTNYRELMELLLEHANYPAIATHDEALITHARAFTAERGITSDQFEFQMLYGVRRDLQEQLVNDGYNLRVYVPYGTDWYPYLTRRIGERPENALFILKSMMKEAFSSH